MLHRSLLVIFAVTAFSGTSAVAQAADPVFTSARQLLARQAKNLVAAAESMPADKYGYRPTDKQMTFGQIVVHTAQANYSLCSRAAGVDAPSIPALKDVDAKEKLVQMLRGSFEFCEQAFSKASDDVLGQGVTLFGGREGTRATALFMTTGTWTSHYSMLAMHLRLNGLLPPTAQ